MFLASLAGLSRPAQFHATPSLLSDLVLSRPHRLGFSGHALRRSFLSRRPLVLPRHHGAGRVCGRHHSGGWRSCGLPHAQRLLRGGTFHGSRFQPHDPERGHDQCQHLYPHAPRDRPPLLPPAPLVRSGGLCRLCLRHAIPAKPSRLPPPGFLPQPDHHLLRCLPLQRPPRERDIASRDRRTPGHRRRAFGRRDVRQSLRHGR